MFLPLPSGSDVLTTLFSGGRPRPILQHFVVTSLGSGPSCLVGGKTVSQFINLYKRDVWRDMASKQVK